jgi:pimeloyl-ACP methyl ester carboxylesterase
VVILSGPVALPGKTSIGQASAKPQPRLSCGNARVIVAVTIGRMKDTPPLPMLVLLPGLDGTGKLFAAFIRALGSGVESHVVGYSLDEPLGYEELELMVRALLPRDRSFVLLGESFSGPIAMRIAASAPARLAGVILCGTFASNPYPWLAWARPFAFLLPIKSLPRWVRAPLMWGSKNPSRAPGNAERAIAGVAGAVVRRRIAAILAVDARESLKRIAIPALVMYSRHDRVVPYAATESLIAHLPGAAVADIDGPHLLLQSCPEECSAAVLKFMTAPQVLARSVAPHFRGSAAGENSAQAINLGEST